MTQPWTQTDARHAPPPAATPARWSGGRAARQPVDFENWSVEFEFRVDGQGTRVFGDGFAFWMTEERAQPGTSTGSAVNGREASAPALGHDALTPSHTRARSGAVAS